MQWMHDLPWASKDGTHPLKYIIDTGVSVSHLREEIYCQVVKQIMSNPNNVSNALNLHAYQLIVPGR